MHMPIKLKVPYLFEEFSVGWWSQNKSSLTRVKKVPIWFSFVINNGEKKSNDLNPSCREAFLTIKNG